MTEADFRVQSRFPGLGGILPPPLGHIPNVRLKSEVSRMEPPACVQNAMMKQDKKPFTYTPGGLDLSEIKSPRMARRIERNANYSGAPEATRVAPQLPSGPLPPSVQAVMQPQMHVQVFPSGPAPPPPGRGIPAPPPPPSHIPPPPPPPTQPLPTQKVVTSDNQVLERPDMTKIIPDNPMALLRRTGGPTPRKSFEEEAFNIQKPQPQPQRWAPAQPPSPPARQPQSPPIQQNQRWVPAQPPSPPQPQQNQRWGPAQPPSPPQPQQNQRWGPAQPPPQQNWAPAQQQSPPIQPPQPRWPQQQAEPPRYHPKIIERTQEPQVKTSTAHLGSLYIPPVNQQPQRKVVSPPTPPQRDSPQVQSPATPTLKEAPKPWQKQTKQAEEIPPWTKRDASPPQSHPNAVYVTQPVVLQHPGPPPNRQQGPVIVPVQADGGKKTPTTPGNERSFNRQQSWSNNPTQSNSFKLIQKITNTDDDSSYDEAPITEHAPKYPQQFQQTPPAEQMRKLKLSEGDRELMNRFKQGVDDDNPLHNEVDPRYRGPAIPSKAFKLLQSMTDGSSDAPVSRGPGGKTPQVRTIPIQIERDEPRNYVPPSEQTVQEPKKYTGSSIPSRSFKILQAMTAPDTCANANEVSENCDPSSYYYPYPYFYNYDPNETNNENCQTPVPFWGYYPPPYAGGGSGRNTPAFWGYPPYYPPEEKNEERDKKENRRSFPPYPYPSYWDPYYYYYGYPPYPPYPFYETEESPQVHEAKLEEIQTKLETAKEIPESEAEEEIEPKIAAEISESESEEETEPKLTRYKGFASGLQAIHSVKDFSLYVEEITEASLEESEEEDDSSYLVEDDTVPHQLSTISEESDHSKREASVVSDCTTFAEKSDDEYEEVTMTFNVKIPSRIDFNLSESQIDEINEEREESEKEEGEEEEQDWWDILNKGEDETFTEKRESHFSEAESEVQNEEEFSRVLNKDEIFTKNRGNLESKDELFFQNEKEGSSEDEIFTRDTETRSPEEFEEHKGEDETFTKKENREPAEERSSCFLSKGKDEIFTRNRENLESKDEFFIQNEEEGSPCNFNKSKVEIFTRDKKNHSSEEEFGKRSRYIFNKGEDEIFTKENREEFFVPSDEGSSCLLNKGKDEIFTRNLESKDEFFIQNEEEGSPSNSNKSKVEIFTRDKKNHSSEEEFGKRSRYIFNKGEDEIFTKENREEFFVPSDEGSSCVLNKGKDEIFTRNLESKDEFFIQNEEEGSSCNFNKSKVTRNKENHLPAGEDETFRKKENQSQNEEGSSGEETIIKQEIVEEEEEDASSTSSSNSSSSKSDASQEEKEINNNDKREPQTIQERIQALRESIQKKKNPGTETEAKVSVKEKVSQIQLSEEEGDSSIQKKKNQSKGQVNKTEELSEEEGDSGVTSDMSRHISDEEFPELKKMTRYQRAATHSRLFKLLQDECEEEEKKEDKFSKLSVRRRDEETARRDQLTLPLDTSEESFSSSEITSPSSPVNERLVSELVQSMLKRKKGQVFKNVPKEKLQAAAKRILQEEIDDMSPDSSFLSPLRNNSTESSTPAQTPQEFYSDYKQYYDSWSEAESYDILPSKAFKLLQEHSGSNKTGAVAGLLAKCPKVLSSKNVHQELTRLVESPESPSPDEVAS